MAASAHEHNQDGPNGDRYEPKGYMGRSLVFYAEYHSDPVNIAIHVMFVPLIILSAMIFLAYIPALSISETALDGLPIFVQRSLDVSAGSMLLLAYVALYSTWDPVAGLSWAAFTAFPLLMLANYIQGEVDKAWAWAIGLQVLSWYMQIHPGHLICEKRKPALLDSLVQAFVTAPLFVWLDLLFIAGYKPQLQAAVKSHVKAAKERMAAEEASSRAKAE